MWYPSIHIHWIRTHIYTQIPTDHYRFQKVELFWYTNFLGVSYLDFGIFLWIFILSNNTYLNPYTQGTLWMIFSLGVLVVKLHTINVCLMGEIIDFSDVIHPKNICLIMSQWIFRDSIWNFTIIYISIRYYAGSIHAIRLDSYTFYVKFHSNHCENIFIEYGCVNKFHTILWWFFFSVEPVKMSSKIFFQAKNVNWFIV